MTNKTLGLISLCRRAGRLKMGFDACLEAVAAREAKLILYAGDLSPKTKLRLEDAFSRAPGRPPCLQTNYSMFDLSQVCGKRTGVVAILDDGFARGLQDLISAENKKECSE